NPFWSGATSRFAGNPSTVISFQLPVSSEMKLAIYNANGQLVRALYSGEMPAGRFSVVWDGTNEAGMPVASGVYLYEIKAGTFKAQRRLVLMK
ncbi:MAG: FlgD immunoglobulin-like domain containing protein, partial [bacterium]